MDDFEVVSCVNHRSTLFLQEDEQQEHVALLLLVRARLWDLLRARSAGLVAFLRQKTQTMKMDLMQ
jgi:hypothetical protein